MQAQTIAQIKAETPEKIWLVAMNGGRPVWSAQQRSDKTGGKDGR